MAERGVIMIQVAGHAEGKESRKERSKLVNAFASAEVRRYPNFRGGRNGGAITVEVDVDEFRADRTRKGTIMLSINDDGTDFGENISVGPPVAELERVREAEAQQALPTM